MEFKPDEAIVRRLVASQFPQWRGLTVVQIKSSGTDNAVFRLGEDMAVRLPRVDYAARLLLKEAACLPLLAPLPLEIPVVLGLGRPDETYPWNWLVVSWLQGEPVDVGQLNAADAAQALGGFVKALQAIDVGSGPAAGPASMGRGAPLAARDARTREWLVAIADVFAPGPLLKIWDAALKAPAHAGPGAWVHGDLHAGNLLQREGRLSGVIDFGLLGIGDPAVDLAPAWNLLPAEIRGMFRGAAGGDAAMWIRGRAWALSVAASQLAHYRDSNSWLAGMARRTLEAVLADGAG